MSTIEEDVERVRAVTDKLGLPDRVWIVSYSNRHGEGVLGAYSTSKKAEQWLRAEIDNLLDLHHIDEIEHHAMVVLLCAGEAPYCEAREIFYCTIDLEVDK